MTAVIAHTTDLSGADTPAFVHAAALAASSGAKLITIHGDGPGEDTARLPDAAELSARWGRAIDHERRSYDLGAPTGHAPSGDALTVALEGSVRAVHPGLVVTGTHARRGPTAVHHGSVSEAFARDLEVPTLVVPNRGRSFVDPDTGAIALRRVLIPASDAGTVARGLAAARALIALAGATEVELLVLLVSGHALELPLDPEVRVLHAWGALDEAILDAVRAHTPCLIAMPTAGSAAVDEAFAAHTEHIIRAARCPVLTVPAVELGA